MQSPRSPRPVLSTPVHSKITWEAFWIQGCPVSTPGDPTRVGRREAWAQALVFMQPSRLKRAARAGNHGPSPAVSKVLSPEKGHQQLPENLLKLPMSGPTPVIQNPKLWGRGRHLHVNKPCRHLQGMLVQMYETLPSS